MADDNNIRQSDVCVVTAAKSTSGQPVSSATFCSADFRLSSGEKSFSKSFLRKLLFSVYCYALISQEMKY